MLASLCPVIRTSRIEESRAFYTGLFGFKVTYETPWYVDLARPALPPRELSLIDLGHPAVPEAQRLPVRAVRIVLESEAGEAELQHALSRAGFDARRVFRPPGRAPGALTLMDPSGVRVHVVAPA